MRIREARKAVGMRQGELARIVGVSSAAVCQWESGKTRPCIDKLRQIADALNVTVNDLLEERAI